MQHRAIAAAGIAANLLLGAAVFLAWVSASDGSASVAGWGSESTPRLLGMLVLGCSAVGIALLAAVGWTVAGSRRRWSAVAAALADLVAVVCLVEVVAAPSTFAGITSAASGDAGAWLALGAAVVAGAVGVVAAVLPPGTESAVEVPA